MKSKKSLNIDWVKPIIKFDRHFGYSCDVPQDAVIDSEEDFKKFSDLIDKCIEDDFDYTIELLGTVPPTHTGLPDIIWD